jgi:hypothetical protein
VKQVMRVIVVLAIAIGIIVSIYLLGKGDMSARESALMSILLTGLSILASWVATAMYADSQHKAAIEEVQELHKSNLRTYALKAAEKVTNLSNELAKLSVYLQQELDFTEYRSTEEELLAKEERVESAIHIINTLKSVNDTSLSDWQGVIGEELDEQREEQKHREHELLGLLERTEESMAELRSKQEATGYMQKDLEALRRDLRAVLSTGRGLVPPVSRNHSAKTRVELPCPSCGEIVRLRQRPVSDEIKGTRCVACDTRLASVYKEKEGFVLSIRIPVRETFVCPICDGVITGDLDPLKGSMALTSCSQCQGNLTIVRTADGVQARVTEPKERVQPPPKVPVSESLIEAVMKGLPPQPWPDGTHKIIAKSIGVTPQSVNQAINELIRRGQAFPQVDGVVFYPVGDGASAAKTDSNAGKALEGGG